MGEALIGYDPQLAQVLFGTNLLTSQGWKADLGYQHEEKGDLLV